MTEAPRQTRDLPVWSGQRAGRRPAPGTARWPGTLMWCSS